MIENYIEKDIIRRVKLTEYFYELKCIDIYDVSKFLKVDILTIKRDIDFIEQIFSDAIMTINKDKNIYTVLFKNEYGRYQLIKRIYAESKFLRVCSKYILGERNSEIIAEEEFISLSTAFKLKREIREFLSESIEIPKDKLIMERQDKEIRYRQALLSVWMRSDILNKGINYDIWDKVENFVEFFLDFLTNNLSQKDTIFFKRSLYIAIVRNNYPLSIPNKDLECIKKGVIFPLLKKYLKRFFDCNLNDEDVVYLTMVYRLLPYNAKNYISLQVDHEEQRKQILAKTNNFLELLRFFERDFGISLIGNFGFEKAFFHLIYSAWQGLQLFSIGKHYFLNQEQRIMKKRIKKDIKEWSHIYYNDKILASDTEIDQFCIRVTEILISNLIPKVYLVIVAENADSHVVYREYLKKSIFNDLYSVDDVMYYSLKELPNYYNRTGIILCERSVFLDDDVERSNIYPVSLYTLTNDMNKFFSKVFLR